MIRMIGPQKAIMLKMRGRAAKKARHASGEARKESPCPMTSDKINNQTKEGIFFMDKLLNTECPVPEG
jgi:hypothetical protein